LDNDHYAWGEPGYHYPQALGLQVNASGSLEEAQTWRGEEVGSEGRGREALIGWVYT